MESEHQNGQKNCKQKAHFRNPKQLIEGEIIKKKKQIKQIKLTKKYASKQPVTKKMVNPCLENGTTFSE